MKYFCTYFDSGFLRRALALYNSLKININHEFKLYTLCFDELSFSTIKKLSYENFIPISLNDLLVYDRELADCRLNRSIVEFYFTCTAALLLYLMETSNEIDNLIYLDADIFFFNNPEPIFYESKNASIVLVEHRYSPNLKGYERNGIYNVSWVGFCRDENGMAALNWWRERCLEWCYDRHENGKYADQKYLDDWPSRFKNVHVIKHIGANLAPWNIGNYKIGFDGKIPTVNGQPLIFFHFHGLKKLGERLYDPNLSSYGLRLEKILIDRIYLPYIRTIESLQDQPPIDYKLRGNGLRLIARKAFFHLQTIYKRFNNELISV